MQFASQLEDERIDFDSHHPARAIAQRMENDEVPAFSSSLHDARILEFARDFMGIVNAALSRPANVPEHERQLQASR